MPSFQTPEKSQSITPETQPTTGKTPRTPREESKRFFSGATGSPRKQLKFSPEKSRTPIAPTSSPAKISSTSPYLFTTTYLAHDTLDQLLNSETLPEKKLVLKSALCHLFNPKRELLHKEARELDTILTGQLQRLTYEEACAGMYLQAIDHVLAEDMLTLEDNCINFIIRIEQAIQIELNKNTISTMKENLVRSIMHKDKDASLHKYPIGKIIDLLSEKSAAQLSALKTQLDGLRINRKKRWTNIVEEIQKELEDSPIIQENAIYGIIQEKISASLTGYMLAWEKSGLSHILPQPTSEYFNTAGSYFYCLSQKTALATQLSKKSTSICADWQEISRDDYATLSINERVDFVTEQCRLNHDRTAQAQREYSETTLNKAAIEEINVTEKAEEETKVLIEDLQAEKESLCDLLKKASIEELRQHQKKYQKEFETKTDEKTLIQEQLQNTATKVGESSHAIASLSPVRKSKNFSHKDLESLIKQPINLLVEDEQHHSLLDKAIKSRDVDIIDYIFTYTKDKDIDRNEMMLQAIRKLELNNDSTGLLYLVAQGYFFSQTFQDYLRSHRTLSRNFSTGTPEFRNFFNDNNHLLIINTDNLSILEEPAFTYLVKHVSDAYWPIIHAEITRRYCPSNLTTNSSLPAGIWHRLCEVQREGERFEKLTTFFAEATSHVITAYQRDPEHYAKKIDTLLEQLHEPLESDETLPQQAKRIARVLSKNNGTMAIARDFRPTLTTATQRVFQRQHQQLKALTDKKQMPPTLYLNELSVIHDPHKIETIDVCCLTTTLEKTSGAYKEREKRHQRAVIAQDIFRKTLHHLREPQYENKRNILNGLIEQYERGDLCGIEFLEKIQQQIDPKKHITNDKKEKLGTPRPTCWAATFGQNKTSQLIRQALKGREKLLLEYGTSL